MLRRRGVGAALCGALLVLLVGARTLAGESFEDRLAQVDAALKANPKKVNHLALNSCIRQRAFAVQLFQEMEVVRANRSLDFCFRVLEIEEKPPEPRKQTSTNHIEQIQAKAARELEAALHLEPDLSHGLEIYRGCAECHTPEGFGLKSGLVPQLAGQHRGVVIKQLADIRAGNRQTVVMAPYATVEVIGGVQSVADVAAYIDTLEISTGGGKGPGEDLELGERLYAEQCARCHGAQGEGNPDKLIPRIQAQHFNYLVRQFEWIRDGRRRNADAEMRAQIQDMDEHQMRAVLDYVSRLEPPEAYQAPPGWENPDF